MFKSTKNYTHEQGLSCCFRQYKADSHCNLLHGYAIGVKLTFANRLLDHRNWVMDFGALGPVKELLKTIFDHKLLVAKDDPNKDDFCRLADLGLAHVVLVDAVGCEAFALLVYEKVNELIRGGTTKLESVEIMEHAGNSAIYSPQIDWDAPNPVDPEPDEDSEVIEVAPKKARKTRKTKVESKDTQE